MIQRLTFQLPAHNFMQEKQMTLLGSRRLVSKGQTWDADRVADKHLHRAFTVSMGKQGNPAAGD